MGGLAGIIKFNNTKASPDELNEMMKLIPHRGLDGIATAIKDQCGLGQARVALRKSEQAAPFKLKHPTGRYYITADSRLYNRNDLICQLGDKSWINNDSPDSAILMVAYERWGELMLEKLDGDYSFAIYDYHKEKLFAARDPFGIKPLFYHWQQGCFMFASEPKQILIHADVAATPDDMIVGEFLFMSFQDNRRTFYQEISRLRPAHYLLVTKKGVVEHRYWNPKHQVDTGCYTKQEYLDKFRKLFKQAVNKRLKTDWPIVSQLSGGLDSSSIVVMAAELFQENSDKFPEFSTVSAVFDNMECDESKYIAAVLDLVPFKSKTFNPTEDAICEGLKEEIYQLDSPFTDIQRAVFNHTAKHINSQNGRLLLTGLGGDELTHEEYYLRDLANNSKYGLLLSEAWKGSKTSWNSFSWLFIDAIRSQLPSCIKKLYQKIKRNVMWTPPIWINSQFADYFKSCPFPPALPDLGYPSKIQNAIFAFMNFPSICWALEALECKSAYQGFEVSHPFMDRELTEFAANIPLNMRITNGHWKYLLIASLEGLLPDKVRYRTRKTHFDSFEKFVYYHNKNDLGGLVFKKSSFESKYYINQEIFLSEFNAIEESKSNYSQDENMTWRVINNELWLRHIKDRY